jgi:hypothetical protein
MQCLEKGGAGERSSSFPLGIVRAEVESMRHTILSILEFFSPTSAKHLFQALMCLSQYISQKGRFLMEPRISRGISRRDNVLSISLKGDLGGGGVAVTTKDRVYQQSDCAWNNMDWRLFP